MDLHFISYPKSGRSWLRYAMTVLDYADEINFHHDDFPFMQKQKPPHDFSLQKRLNAYGQGCRVIYLTRDPRDTMVSLFHQVTGRFGPVFDFQGDMSDFIRDPWFGAENLKKFRDIWDEMCVRELAIKVTYEQAHTDFKGTLGRILTHYGYQPTEQELIRAKDAASFQNMKKVEQSQTFPKNWLRPKNGAVKVRKGKVGGYAEVLSDKDIRYLNTVFSIDD